MKDCVCVCVTKLCMKGCVVKDNVCVTKLCDKDAHERRLCVCVTKLWCERCVCV